MKKKNCFKLFNLNLLYKWGHSTTDEMCFNFMYYYPKIVDAAQCFSLVAIPELLGFYVSLIRFLF